MYGTTNTMPMNNTMAPPMNAAAPLPRVTTSMAPPRTPAPASKGRSRPARSPSPRANIAPQRLASNPSDMTRPTHTTFRPTGAPIDTSEALTELWPANRRTVAHKPRTAAPVLGGGPPGFNLTTRPSILTGASTSEPPGALTGTPASKRKTPAQSAANAANTEKLPNRSTMGGTPRKNPMQNRTSTSCTTAYPRCGALEPATRRFGTFSNTPNAAPPRRQPAMNPEDEPSHASPFPSK